MADNNESGTKPSLFKFGSKNKVANKSGQQSVNAGRMDGNSNVLGKWYKVATDVARYVDGLPVVEKFVYPLDSRKDLVEVISVNKDFVYTVYEGKPRAFDLSVSGIQSFSVNPDGTFTELTGVRCEQWFVVTKHIFGLNRDPVCIRDVYEQDVADESLVYDAKKYLGDVASATGKVWKAYRSYESVAGKPKEYYLGLGDFRMKVNNVVDGFVFIETRGREGVRRHIAVPDGSRLFSSYDKDRMGTLYRSSFQFYDTSVIHASCPLDGSATMIVAEYWNGSIVNDPADLTSAGYEGSFRASVNLDYYEAPATVAFGQQYGKTVMGGVMFDNQVMPVCTPIFDLGDAWYLTSIAIMNFRGLDYTGLFSILMPKDQSSMKVNGHMVCIESGNELISSMVANRPVPPEEPKEEVVEVGSEE